MTDTRAHRAAFVIARRLQRLVLALALPGLAASALAGCDWTVQRRQGLVVRCNRPKALLYINEKLVGAVGDKRPVRIWLNPGRYRIAVKRTGFFTRYVNVHVKREQFLRLNVVLRPELD